MSTMGETLLAEFVEAIEANPALRERLRDLFVPSTTPTMPQLLNLTRFASLMGVGRDKVSEWLALGMPVERGGKKTIRIDVARARAWLGDGGPQNATEARARRDAIKAAKKDE